MNLGLFWVYYLFTTTITVIFHVEITVIEFNQRKIWVFGRISVIDAAVIEDLLYIAKYLVISAS